MQNNNFCKECSSLLRPKEFSEEDKEEDNGLFLVCPECSYREKILTFNATFFSKKKENIHLVNKFRRANDFVYDMTLPRTMKIQCINKECKSNKTKKKPEIVIITSKDEPEVTYLCTVCKDMWSAKK